MDISKERVVHRKEEEKRRKKKKKKKKKEEEEEERKRRKRKEEKKEERHNFPKSSKHSNHSLKRVVAIFNAGCDIYFILRHFRMHCSL